MTMGLTEINAAIHELDKRITANQRSLRGMEHIKAGATAADFQAAWDEHPDLYATECDLFRQRGELQRERAKARHDQAMHAARVKRTARAPRGKRCPACAGTGRVAKAA